MSPDGCPEYPNDGVYYISVDNQWVGNQKVPGGDNIVVNNHKTPFYLRWLHKDPCTYEISLGTHGYTNFVQDDEQRVDVKGKYQQWVLRRAGGDGYFIALAEDTNIVWTDMGPRGPAHHQIRLKQLVLGNSAQRFRIRK